MSSTTPDFQAYRLIELVKANRCLYDHRDANHNNRAVVNSVWRAIAQEMCQPESVCREKWINLRSNYARELRKTRRKINEMDVFPTRRSLSQWAYYETLSFLAPFVRTRLDTVEGEMQQHPEKIRIKLERLEPVEPDPLNLVEMPEEVSSSESDLNERMQQRWLAEMDDDRLFLLSLLPKMKRLNMIENFKFRVEVQTLLLNRLQAEINDNPSINEDPLAPESE